MAKLPELSSISMDASVKATLAANVPSMMSALIDLTSKRNKSPKLRLDAIKTALGLAGYVAPKAGAASSADQSLHEMDLSALRAMHERLESELAGRAKVIPAPTLPEVALEPESIADLIG